jgi:hypothetical protein
MQIQRPAIVQRTTLTVHYKAMGDSQLADSHLNTMCDAEDPAGVITAYGQADSSCGVNGQALGDENLATSQND